MPNTPYIVRAMQSAFGAHIGLRAVSQWQPAGNTSNIAAVGDGPLSAVGTATIASFATTNLYTKMRKLEYLVSVAATNAVAGFRCPQAKWTVGDTANEGAGGFTLICRWGPATGVATTTTSRGFCGMGSAGTPTDAEPSAQPNIVGMGWDAADTNIQLMHRGVGAITKIDLGANFPVPTVNRTKVYQLILFSPPGTTQSVRYEVKDLSTGAVGEGTITTNLPTTTTGVTPKCWMSVGGTSSVVGVALFTLYVESDF